MIQIPMTPDQFSKAGQELQARQGITLTGNEGTISKMGVTAAYKYDGAHLTVTVTDKPFFVTEEYCEGELRKFLGA